MNLWTKIQVVGSLVLAVGAGGYYVGFGMPSAQRDATGRVAKPAELVEVTMSRKGATVSKHLEYHYAVTLDGESEPVVLIENTFDGKDPQFSPGEPVRVHLQRGGLFGRWRVLNGAPIGSVARQ